MTDGNAMKNLVIEGQNVFPIQFPTNDPIDLIPIVKTDIPQLAPNIAFILDNVLSPSECKFIVNCGEKIGFDDLHHYNKKYRDNMRILTKSKSLSDVVLERIKPFLLKTFEVGGSKGHETLSAKYLGAPKGKWSLLELNDLWRLCKYNPGGKFLPHYDGLYVKDKNTRSFLTFMIYLNNTVGCGGDTSFLDETPGIKSSDRTVCKVTPKTGSVLVFQHNLYHQGDILDSGLKYIIRSDIMYSYHDPITTLQQLEIEREARRILAEAIDKEKTNVTEAVTLYKRAFKLHPPLEFES